MVKSLLISHWIDNVIFGAGADPGRNIVTKFVLWVPKMMFNAIGEQMFKNYLKLHAWSYLRDSVEISPTTQQHAGTFKLTSSIRKPRRVYLGT